MLTLEQGAKYFIVAWIKNWKTRTLLDALDGKHGELSEERLKALVDQFPFLPNNIGMYICNKGSGMLMKVAMPDISKKLNNALWDAKDDKQRLSFYPYVMKMKTNKAVHTRKYNSEDQIENNRQHRENKATDASYFLSRAYFKKCQGHDWFTVK